MPIRFQADADLNQIIVSAVVRRAPAIDFRTATTAGLGQTGISLRLDLGPSPDYRDIARWARTSPWMVATFYDQTHPQLSVERIVGFRKRSKPSGKESEESVTSPRPGAPKDGTILPHI
jgi:hypothetical protein